MFDDDDRPKKVETVTRNLDAYSINELENYIEELAAEIVRAEAEIKKKRDVHSAADSIFK